MKVELVNASDTFDDDNDGLIYGLMGYDEEFLTCDYVEWFKTREERNKVIIKNKFEVI